MCKIFHSVLKGFSGFRPATYRFSPIEYAKVALRRTNTSLPDVLGMFFASS